MSDNVLETVRATVQDLIAPEMKTHGVRLDHIERRLDEMRTEVLRSVGEAKETLRAEIKALESRFVSLEARFVSLESRFETLEVRFHSVEDLIRMSMRQIESDGALRERVALLEVRMPKQ